MDPFSVIKYPYVLKYCAPGFLLGAEMLYQAPLQPVPQVRLTAQVARELGVNVNTLYTWMSHFKEHPSEPFVGSGNLHQEDAGLRALKKRIKDLEEENEFLKKASAFFARNLK